MLAGVTIGASFDPRIVSVSVSSMERRQLAGRFTDGPEEKLAAAACRRRARLAMEAPGSGSKSEESRVLTSEP